MLVGCTTIRSTVEAAVLRHGTEYRKQDDSFEQSASISLDGTIEFNRSTNLVFKGGGGGVAKLPLSVLLRIGNQEVFDDPDAQQTLPRDGGLIIDNILSRLGYFVFVPAYADRELAIKEPDTVYAELNLSESLFSDIWQWARNGCLGTASVHLEVFGPFMQREDSFNPDYEWDVGDGNEYRGLNVGSFDFSVRHKEKSKPASGDSH